MSDNKFPVYKKTKVKDLIPYARNSRTHSDEQIDQIARSIQEFGFLAPLIVNEKNEIIAGHGRLMAAKKIGLDEVPCIQADHLTDEQRRAYVIADNKLTLNSDWDFDLLKVELADLAGDDFDIELTGFSLGEIANMTLDGTNLVRAESPYDFKEVEVSNMECICPKCGFEFDA